MKAAGLLLIFASASFAGFIFSDNYLSVLKEAKRAEELLKNIVFGIRSENMTLPEIFENIKNLSDKNTKTLISGLNFENLDKIDIYIKKCGFSKNQTTISVLKKAFSVLGKYSASEQTDEIEHCIDSLKSFYEKNEKELLNKAKLSKSFGIMIGVLAVIMLA